MPPSDDKPPITSSSPSSSSSSKRNNFASTPKHINTPDMDILSNDNPIHPPLVHSHHHHHHRQPKTPPSTPEDPTVPLNLEVSPQAVEDDDPSRNIAFKNTHFRDAPLGFLREVSMMYSGTGWRSYDNPIGQPIFYKGFTEDMKSWILNSPLVREKIAELAESRTDVEDGMGVLHSTTEREARRRQIERDIEDVADNIADNMICKFESKSFIRGAYFLSNQVLSRTYHQGIHVSTGEVINLTKIAKECERRKQSMIFLPCHRSHIDYVSLQVICYRLGIALPSVIAGDNLNFPVVGPFLQHAGAFWIRRQMGDDALYGAMVQAYVDVLLKKGYNMECFIEGTRSRTGKLLPPKFGILNFILSSVLSGRTRDCYIVPVSTQYDKVIETESYISELLGVPKKKENLWDFLSSSSVLSLKMGRVDVRFHEPWSLREFISRQLARTASIPISVTDVVADGGGRKQQGEIELTPNQRVRLLRSMGYKVLSDINACSVVMPTALIGTILLTLRGRGVGKSELIRRIEWLKSRIRAKGGKVAHFGGAGPDVVVQRGLEVLGDLVGKVDGLAEETFYAVDRFQLSFYRNMVIHLFILEAVVAAAMYTRVKQGGGPDNQRVPFDELFKHVTFLSQLFRGEFVFPTEGILTNLHATLKGLEDDGVIRVGRNENAKEGIEYVELSDVERRCGRENFDFYCFLIWPFIEGVWLAGVAITGIALGSTTTTGTEEEKWVDSKSSLEMAQSLGKTLYHQGDLSYFEAVNIQTLKNAFQRFEEEGILLSRKTPAPPPPPAVDGVQPEVVVKPVGSQIRVASEWEPSREFDDGGQLVSLTGRLWEFVEMVAVTRREGKNRRDNATVSGRVLRLAESLGVTLFEGEKVRAADRAAGIVGKKGKKGKAKARARL